MKQETLDSLRRYRKDGIPPGDFLQAVLTNDLLDAFGRSDEENERDLKEIVMWVYWEMPNRAWGSVQKVQGWIEKKERERRQHGREGDAICKAEFHSAELEGTEESV